MVEIVPNSTCQLLSPIVGVVPRLASDLLSSMVEIVLNWTCELLSPRVGIVSDFICELFVVFKGLNCSTLGNSIVKIWPMLETVLNWACQLLNVTNACDRRRRFQIKPVNCCFQLCRLFKNTLFIVVKIVTYCPKWLLSLLLLNSRSKLCLWWVLTTNYTDCLKKHELSNNLLLQLQILKM